jgi:hypothetical protein
MGQSPSALPRTGVSASVKVNRTDPQATQLKAGLEFSDRPTTQEISEARVFEESLVPIGIEPTDDENASLAAAPLAYPKRAGLDDFASLTRFLERCLNKFISRTP